jgi:ABC-type nitrate/sulfonate/bicarbonate transport system permease component
MGFVMFARRSVEVTLFSFIEVIRPIPPIALTPFFILWFQLSVIGQIALVAVGCMMVMVVSTHESLQSVALDLRRSAYSLGIRGFAFYRHIMLPAIAPQLVAPLRVALALAFALAVAAEFMGAQQGIGFLMMVARRTLQTETILMGVMVLGVLSAALDYILRLIFRRVNRWQA